MQAQSTRLPASLLPCALAAACASAPPVHTGVRSGASDPATIAAAVAQADSVRRSFTDADVHFMSGMVPHHAQAVLMAKWAPTHGARADVSAFCERIVVGQGDEIEIMRTWLRDKGQPVPPANATRHRMRMGGTEHDMLMPGMLSDVELAQLDGARGPEFDRLFLTLMIRHHEGAITMVEELFGSTGAAQDELIIKLASDIYADQTSEIGRMKEMLTAMGIGGPPS